MRVTVGEAIELIRDGEIVAIPTDTVYGLLVDPSKPQAVQELYGLKGRHAKKPMALLGASWQQLASLCREEPPGLTALRERFWPGPLTLIVPVCAGPIKSQVCGDGETIGLRIPNHPQALAVLKACGPLAAPSANPAGEPPALNADEVEGYYGTDLPVMVAEVPPLGKASTLLLAEGGRWCCLREGALSLSQIRKVVP